MSAIVEQSVDYAIDRFDDFVEDVKTLVGFSSVSSDENSRSDIDLAVEWITDRLTKASLENVQTFDTTGNPIVFANRRVQQADAPTVLIYGHYDVVPAGPTNAWSHDPFTATIDGEYLFGRGTSDMKAQLLACITAVEAAALSGSIPINIKFLIEGNEEFGSGEVARFIADHKESLECDFCLNCDAGMVGPHQPSIVYGLRGRATSRIIVIGASKNVHDGEYGGVIRNPTHALSELIAGLHDAHGHIKLPGFYDRVSALAKDEQTELARLPLDSEFFLSSSGATELWGEKPYQPIERVGARPALNVMFLRAGVEKSSIIPAQAEAVVSIRLVPNQDFKDTFEQLSRYVRDNSPSEVTCEVEHLGGYAPSLVDRSSPWVKAMTLALEEVWGEKPLFNRVGGGIPVVGHLQEKLGVESVLTGFGLPNDNIHGPNERVHLPTLKRGIEALVRFFYKLSD